MTIHPIARVLAWWLFWHPATPQAVSGPDPLRLVTRPCLHVGVRPHSDALGDAAVTVQVSVCDPF